MRPLLSLLAVALAGTLHAQTPDGAAAPAEATESAEAKARSGALELAGAFSNDGYKIRDGYYFTELEPGKSAVVEVNLFAGNEYWFCASGTAPDGKVSVRVYGEDGLPVEQQAYDDGSNAAAGVVAGVSGKYLVKLTRTEGEKSPVCFLYCYK